MVPASALLLLVLLWWRRLLVSLRRVALYYETVISIFARAKFKPERERTGEVPEEDRIRAVEEGSSRLGDCIHISAIAILFYLLSPSRWYALQRVELEGDDARLRRRIGFTIVLLRSHLVCLRVSL